MLQGHTHYLIHNFKLYYWFSGMLTLMMDLKVIFFFIIPVHFTKCFTVNLLHVKMIFKSTVRAYKELIV